MQGALAGRKILIVEDDSLIALDMTEALEPTGASIITTNHSHVLIRMTSRAPSSTSASPMGTARNFVLA